MSSDSIASTFPAANRVFLDSVGKDSNHLTLPASRRFVILTCMDPRVSDLDGPLGLERGQAIYIRNAAGRAQDALRSVIIAQHFLGKHEIAVVHHTDCRALHFTTDQIRTKIKAGSEGDEEVSRAADAMELLEFDDVEASVRPDVDFLKCHPLLVKDSVVTGWVYDVTNGKVNQVA